MTLSPGANPTLSKSFRNANLLAWGAGLVGAGVVAIGAVFGFGIHWRNPYLELTSFNNPHTPTARNNHLDKGSGLCIRRKRSEWIVAPAPAQDIIIHNLFPLVLEPEGGFPSPNCEGRLRR